MAWFNGLTLIALLAIFGTAFYIVGERIEHGI